MNLEIKEWKEFMLGRLFSVKYGVNLELNICEETNDKNELSVNFVSRTAENNGVSSRVIMIDGVEPQKAGLISVAGGGSVLSSFLQDEPFYSGRDLYILEAKEDISDKAKLFVITIIEQNKYKYSYGRQANKTMPYLKLLLPIQRNLNGMPIIDQTYIYSDEGYLPDWKWMEDYIESLNHKPITTQNRVWKGLELKVNEWKEFKVGDFFDIHPTKYIEGLSVDDCVGYGVPLVVNSAENNGIAGLCDLKPTEQGGIITFSDTTDGNTFFYQPRPFVGFAHVQGMYPKSRSWSEAEMLFFCTLLMFDSRGKYSYGRKMRRDIISEIMIKLPVDVNGEPDWKFMEEYIKALPYGDRL